MKNKKWKNSKGMVELKIKIFPISQLLQLNLIILK
jgi:hypothetical protein